ncbi:hypothetical protein LRR81_07215 [Metabacillus sp. GX 13764]|uniref:hypothetical protein n=1 Tax=Metabacillus kandeliae TaxID=2900151 RepID=UPI001E4E5EAB|nr:hypothetical protein [Metabacillus kandeliae]MCD7034023.1 hypothetical protein [Metabacillus kandeliae]
MEEQKKKMTLEEAVKAKLASKKQEQGKASHGIVKTAKKLQSQQTKKINNQRKRMGV